MGWEGQWDCDVFTGTRESRGHPIVQRGLWDGKDSGTVMSLLGHRSLVRMLMSQSPKGTLGPPSLVCSCKLDIDMHVTPFLKILATGLSSLAVLIHVSKKETKQ